MTFRRIQKPIKHLRWSVFRNSHHQGSQNLIKTRKKNFCEKHVKFEDSRIWKNSVSETLRKDSKFLAVILINLKVTKIYAWLEWW